MYRPTIKRKLRQKLSKNIWYFFSNLVLENSPLNSCIEYCNQQIDENKENKTLIAKVHDNSGNAKFVSVFGKPHIISLSRIQNFPDQVINCFNKLVCVRALFHFISRHISKTFSFKKAKINPTCGFLLLACHNTSHSAYVATSTESVGAKINGFLCPNFM